MGSAFRNAPNFIEPTRVKKRQGNNVFVWKFRLILFSSIIRSAFTRPRAVFHLLNSGYLKILLNALKTEHPLKILTNFQRKVYEDDLFTQMSDVHNASANPVLTTGYIGQSGTELKPGEIAFFIDVMSYSRITHELVIGGWATDPSGIGSIEIFAGKTHIGHCHTGSPREDIGNLFPDNPKSGFAGFNFVTHHKLKGQEIVVKISNSKGQWRWESFQPTISVDDLTIDKQYTLFLEAKGNKDIALERKKKIADTLSKRGPLISVVTPVFNTRPNYLSACIQSVVGQLYGKWELCLYDDSSTDKETLAELKKWVNSDPRIRVEYGTDNLHISGATNAAIRMASGDFIALLDHDDELAPEALLAVAEVIDQQPEVDFIYSDEDKIDALGRRCDPHFKPDFNQDLFLSTNYICHLAVIRKSLGDRVGWFRKGFEGSQDYDLFLRITDYNPNIHHIPEVLYHWRKVPGSTAAVYSHKGYADDSAWQALVDYVGRNQIEGRVERGLFPGAFRIVRDITEKKLVSIIIPFKDQVQLLANCIDSLFATIQYQPFELLLVNNMSSESQTIEYLRKLKARHPSVTILDYNFPFNYSAINNWAVQQAKGQYVLFLNNDTKAMGKGWLSAMVEHIQRDNVGAVGARLLYPDMTVQHAGVILNLKGLAGHAHRHLPDDMSGYFLRSVAIQNFSACTAACLLVKKAIFEKVNGFDEIHLPIAFNDIDLCLKIRSLDKLIVYTPYARLIHFESKSRGSDQTSERVRQFQAEIDFFKKKWKSVLDKGDPYYNPNLDLQSEWFSLDLSQAQYES